MAWVTPPTFADGEVLSAAKLNQLSDGVNWLNGLQAAPAAIGLTLAATSTTSYEFWCHRHRHRYLQIRYWTDGADEINVWYNGTKVFYDNDPDNGDLWMLHQGTTVMDLNSVAGMVAYGQPYVLTIELKPLAGGKIIKLRQVSEMNVTSP